MKVTFTTGSPNKFDNFEFFDIHHDGSDDQVYKYGTRELLGGNGVDAHGQGIYGFEGVNGKDAKMFSGDNGCVYICSVEVESFANDIPANEISKEKWMEVISNSIRNIKELKGFNENKILSDSMEVDLSNEKSLDEFFENHSNWLDRDDFDMDSVDDNYELKIMTQEFLSYSNPAADIEESFDYFDLDQYLSDDDVSVWDLHIAISNGMHENSRGRVYFSKCYYEGMTEAIGNNPKFTAARIRPDEPDQKGIIICIAKDLINIEKRIELGKNKNKECDMEIDL